MFIMKRSSLSYKTGVGPLFRKAVTNDELIVIDDGVESLFDVEQSATELGMFPPPRPRKTKILEC